MMQGNNGVDVSYSVQAAYDTIWHYDKWPKNLCSSMSEFSSASVIEREFAPLKEVKDNFPKYVVWMDRYAERNIDGVIGIHLKDFLLNEI